MTVTPHRKTRKARYPRPDPATANCDGAYERPADACLSGSISSCVENGLVRKAMQPEFMFSAASATNAAQRNDPMCQ